MQTVIHGRPPTRFLLSVALNKMEHLLLADGFIYCFATAFAGDYLSDLLYVCTCKLSAWAPTILLRGGNSERETFASCKWREKGSFT